MLQNEWKQLALVLMSFFLFILEELYKHNTGLVDSSTSSQLMVLDVSLSRRSLLFSANSKSLHDTN